MSDGTTRTQASPVPRLLRRRTSPDLAVLPHSIALFRLGEQCNNKCPMCSNSGRPEAYYQSAALLVGRADFLHAQGMRRVVLTGGEPTIHPGFWDVVARLGEHGMAWDTNTNGRSFADPAFTARAVESGLLRAIVSLHSHEAEASQIVSGVSAKGHAEIVAGIDELLKSGVDLMVNCVLTKHSQGKLLDFLHWCHARWQGGFRVKIAFPSTAGKGGDWDGIQLRYEDVQGELQAARILAETQGWDVVFEDVPPCVLGDGSARDMSRSGFGETHYLDDVTGDRLYPIRHIEAELSVYAEGCRTCRVRSHCPGISETYARRAGTEALRPM
jgi:MoaA/NifB/PqqE/SkfB family radical SAM enzyme